MAGHGHKELEPAELRMLGTKADKLGTYCLIVAAVSIIASLILAPMSVGGFQRLAHAWLTNLGFFLTIAVGGLAFVLITTLFRAGWCVVVRRVPEVLGTTTGVLGVLFIPLLITVVLGTGTLYDWAIPYEDEGYGGHAAVQPETTADPHIALVADEAADAADAADAGAHADEHGEGLSYFAAKKRPYLNPLFFTVRVIAFFALWFWMASWFWGRSVEQDETGEGNLTLRMQTRAPLKVLLFAMVTTFGFFDLFMSLSPDWYSTMFGVYLFSGAFLSCICVMVLVYAALQRAGYIPTSVTIEHYHDLGKLMFAFVFFWTYVAFSQYMLYAYATIPEEIFWYADRGASAVDNQFNGWTWVSLALLLGHFAIPFAGLLSRHVKRNLVALQFWAVWLLVFHWIDLYWVIMPQIGLDNRAVLEAIDASGHVKVLFGPIEITTFLGIGGVVCWVVLTKLGKHSLIPAKDPRLKESLAFENL